MLKKLSSWFAGIFNRQRKNAKEISPELQTSKHKLAICLLFWIVEFLEKADHVPFFQAAAEIMDFPVNDLKEKVRRCYPSSPNYQAAEVLKSIDAGVAAEIFARAVVPVLHKYEIPRDIGIALDRILISFFTTGEASTTTLTPEMVELVDLYHNFRA